jgi:hypothetical protein
VSKNNPAFPDIIDLLNALVPVNDKNIDAAPHQAFWRGSPPPTRDQFVSMTTDDWGVPGMLVVPGHPDTSNLYLALSGTAPFDGSQLPQMPDTNADPNARNATEDELNLVKRWILNNALA